MFLAAIAGYRAAALIDASLLLSGCVLITAGIAFLIFPDRT